MPDYIFLDSWVLSDYTKEGKGDLLSKLIRENNYTILINGISAVELYNPSWQEAENNDRTSRAARFLSRHSCAVIRPEKVFRGEIESFPRNLERLPIELYLGDLPSGDRESALLSVLRGDDSLRENRIDIKQWVGNYNTAKATWLDDAERIIETACESGLLRRNKARRFVELEKTKEDFLVTLDRRHFSYFSNEERQRLGTKIVELFMGGTRVLPAIRFSSLCFWYAYVDTDRGTTMKRTGSDIGDFFQMSLIPYCSAFTLDATMCRLARRVVAETHYRCRTYDHAEFNAILGWKQG
jgi:hypothetical protein